MSQEQRQFLAWAAELHEVGLAVSHSQFHRHGAYLLENSDLAGFSRPEQQSLAFLVRAHRRKFPAKELDALPAATRSTYARLARLLRLAVALNHSRPEAPVLDVRLQADGETLYVYLDQASDQPLLMADLDQEARYQRNAGFSLVIDA